MKKKITLLLTLAAGILIFSGCSKSDTIVESKAGNISEDEFYEVLKERYGRETLKELVYKKVLEDQYEVSKKEVNEALEEYKDAYGDQFQLFLANLGLSNEEELKDLLKFTLLQEKAAAEKIKVTEKELKEQYNIDTKTVTARHILVEDEKTAKKVKKKLDQGEDFAELAKKYSKDEATAKKGGDLGELNPDELVRPFVVAAFKLEENEISDPVESDYGYHIIQATKVEKKKNTKSFEEMKPELEKAVKRAKLDTTAVQKALDEAVEKANVKIKDKDLKDLFDDENEN